MTIYQYRMIMFMLWLIILFLADIDNLFVGIVCFLFCISYLIGALVSELKKEPEQ